MPIRPTRTSPEKVENIPSVQNIPQRGAMIVAPDTRIHELNRRLSSRPADPDNLWYIFFVKILVGPFFDDLFFQEAFFDEF